MKKLFLQFLILGLISTAHAQDYYYESPGDAASAHQRSAAERQRRIDNHITGVKVYCSKSDSTTPSNPGVLYSESTYDANGNTKDFKMYKKNGKLKYHQAYVWDAKNKKT